MISFKNFLHQYPIAQIEKDCAFILGEYKEAGGGLFHGSRKLKGPGEPVLKLPWKARSVPRDTVDYIHDAINSAFKARYDIEPRNWMFTSPSIHTASAYGNEYLVLPIGHDVEFVYSPVVEDLTRTAESIVKDIKHDMKYKDTDDLQSECIHYFESSFIHDCEYVYTRSISNFLETGKASEVMLKCREFYLISVVSKEFGILNKKYRILE